MAQDTTLRQLLVELLQSYDSSIDTSAGSAFDTAVISPFLERVGPSPLELDLETFLVDRLTVENPDLDVSAYSGIRDLLVRPAKVILEPLRREIAAVKLRQSLANYQSMTRDEVNELLQNYFVTLQDGDKVTGPVRVYFRAPQSVMVTPTTLFQTGTGLNYYPTVVQSISAAAMRFNYDGSLYYFDVTVQSENAGVQYNIKANDINRVVGVFGVTKIANLVDFDTSTNDETKEEGIQRAQDSITVRNLAVLRGIKVVLTENYPFLSILQVVSMGDAEMQRDVIAGPVAVSDIPGGILGTVLPSLTSSAQQVHIGGKTDVYCYQRELVTDSLDLQNITDRGVRVVAGAYGYTNAGGSSYIFLDDRGHFVTYGVRTGDYLRVGQELCQIASVTETTLTLTEPLSGGIYSQTYEVVRKTEDMVYVPLYDVIAERGNAPLLDTSGAPVQPVPGSYTNAPLVDGEGNYVEKTENIGSNNILTPLVWVTSLEFLDPITLETSGTVIPMKDVMRVITLDDFSGGSALTQAGGTLRVYFRDAVNAWAPPESALFVYQTLSYTPVGILSGTAHVPGAGTTLVLENSDSLVDVIKPGYRIAFAGLTYTVLTVVGYVLGVGTTVEVREAFGIDIDSTEYEMYPGVLESTIARDESLGLYYMDVPVLATVTGTAGNIAGGTLLTASGVRSEGWSLRTWNAASSYSTKELAYLELTSWVSDTTDLTEVSTAYAVRVNYEYASKLKDIQTFVEAEENRIIGEDVLIRTFLPAFIAGAFTIKGLSAGSAQAALETFIKDVSPTEDLEVSDLINALYDARATKVKLPVTLICFQQDVERTWTATVVEDTMPSSRVQHFLPDPSRLTVSVE